MCASILIFWLLIGLLVILYGYCTYRVANPFIRVSKNSTNGMAAFEKYEREVREQLKKDRKEFLSYLEKLREREDRQAFSQFQMHKSEQAK